MWFFVQLCSSWLDFNWLKGSCGLSAAAELLVSTTTCNLQLAASVSDVVRCSELLCDGELLLARLLCTLPFLRAGTLAFLPALQRDFCDIAGLKLSSTCWSMSNAMSRDKDPFKWFQLLLTDTAIPWMDAGLLVVLGWVAYKFVCSTRFSTISLLTRRPASADRTTRRQFQATGQPVSRMHASDAMTSRLKRYEANCVQRRCFQCGSVPLHSDIKGTELPPANILIPLERQLIAL